MVTIRHVWLVLTLCPIATVWAQVGIGTTTVDPSAILQLQSTSRGLLLPRVPDPSAVAAPVPGLVVYDESTTQMQFYNGTNWVSAGGSSSQWTTTGSDIYYTGGRVGIGNTAPTNPLDIRASDPFLVNIRRNNTAGSDFSAAITLTNGNTPTANGWQMVVGGTGNGLTPPLANGELYFANGTQLPFVLRNGAGGAETFRVTGTGRVGIGTNNPQSLLHVAGSVQLQTGTISAGAVLTATNSNGVAAWSSALGTVTNASLNITSLAGVGTTPLKYADVGTIVKGNDQTKIVLHLHTIISSTAGAGNYTFVELRLNDAAALNNTGVIGMPFALNNQRHSATALFEGLPAGDYTVSIWIYTLSGSGFTVLLDPGGFRSHLVGYEIF